MPASLGELETGALALKYRAPAIVHRRWRDMKRRIFSGFVSLE